MLGGTDPFQNLAARQRTARPVRGQKTRLDAPLTSPRRFDQPAVQLARLDRTADAVAALTAAAEAPGASGGFLLTQAVVNGLVGVVAVWLVRAAPAGFRLLRQLWTPFSDRRWVIQ